MKQEYHLKLGDNLKRKYFLKFEISSILYKTFILNDFTKNIIKYYLFFKFSKFAKYSRVFAINNRCILSGRKYGLIGFFKLSRFFFRENAQKLKLPGIRRKSW